MTSYKPSSDKITVLGGRVIRPQRAKSLKKELEKELELRENYLESDLHSKDITVSPRTIKILCTDYDCSEDILVTIGFVFEDESVDNIPKEYVIAWINKWDNHGEILVKESDVKSIFNETNVEFSAFNVEFANADTLSDFRTEIENFDS